MARIDEIKEYIGFLKVLFVTLVAIDTSLIAWIFKNYAIYNDKLSVYVVFGVILIITITICFLFVHILENIKKLKDL